VFDAVEVEFAELSHFVWGVASQVAGRPGFPIWSWYRTAQSRRRGLIFMGSDARYPARKGDTLSVRKKPSPFSSRSTAV
jgi:hypothetical protein